MASRLEVQLVAKDNISSSIKSAQGSLSALYRNIGASRKGLKQMADDSGIAVQSFDRIRQQSKALTAEATKLEAQWRALSDADKNSEFGQALRQQAQQFKSQAADMIDTIGDVRSEIKGMASDTANWNALKQGIGIASSSFQSMIGIVGQCGGNIEAFTKALTVMKTVEQATNTVIGIGNALQKDSALMIGLRKAATLLSTSATKANTVATASNTVATEAEAAATTEATAAQWAFNAACEVNPYVLLATAIVALGAAIGGLIIYYDDVIDAQKEEEQELNDLHDAFSKETDGVANNILKIKELQKGWNDLKSDQEKNDFIKNNEDAFHDLGVEIDDVSGAENFLVAQTETFIKAMKLRAKAAAYAALAQEKLKESLRNQDEATDVALTDWEKFTASLNYSWGDDGFKTAQDKAKKAKQNALYNQQYKNQNKADEYLQKSQELEQEASKLTSSTGIKTHKSGTKSGSSNGSSNRVGGSSNRGSSTNPKKTQASTKKTDDVAYNTQKIEQLKNALETLDDVDAINSLKEQIKSLYDQDLKNLENEFSSIDFTVNPVKWEEMRQKIYKLTQERDIICKPVIKRNTLSEVTTEIENLQQLLQKPLDLKLKEQIQEQLDDLVAKKLQIEIQEKRNKLFNQDKKNNTTSFAFNGKNRQYSNVDSRNRTKFEEAKMVKDRRQTPFGDKRDLTQREGIFEQEERLKSNPNLQKGEIQSKSDKIQQQKPIIEGWIDEKVNSEFERLSEVFAKDLEGIEVTDEKKDKLKTIITNKLENIGRLSSETVGGTDTNSPYFDDYSLSIGDFKSKVDSGEMLYAGEEHFKIKYEFEADTSELDGINNTLEAFEAKTAIWGGLKEGIDQFGALNSAIANVYDSWNNFGDSLEDKDIFEQLTSSIGLLVTTLQSGIAIFEAFSAIVDIINLISAALAVKAGAETADAVAQGEEAGATTALMAAEGAQAGAQVAESAAVLPAIAAETSALKLLTAAKNTAAYADMPFVGAGLAQTAMATYQGIWAQAAIPTFSEGGIFRGASNIGDHNLARLDNQEMVLTTRQQSNLFNMLNDGVSYQQSQQPMHVQFKVKGADLVGALNNYETKRSKA